MGYKQLLPERHPQTDIFICDLADAAIKDDVASMEHPIFTLSTKPDTEVKRYERGDDWFEITPSVKGLATIYDKDILIFAISQIMAAKNAGLPYSREIVFNAKDFLVFSNRHTGGSYYDALKDALDRLDGTRIRTNIKTGDAETWEAFGLIDGASIQRKRLDGRVLEWGVTLSKWLFKAIESNEVLTLSPQYFRLRKPLERRLYEVARKHCGTQKKWRINIDLLQKKCGSNSPKRNFRAMLKKVVEHQHLPDYTVSIEDTFVVFTAVKHGASKLVEATIPPLKTTTYEHFKERYHGHDPYTIEAIWRDWAKGKKPPRKVDAAFLAFAEKHIEQKLL